MNKTKLEKGITLVALIITIIVLLILAVVAIAAVQDSGIIGHAQNTVEKQKEAEEIEQAKLLETSIKMSMIAESKSETNSLIFTTEDQISGNDAGSDNGAIYEFLVRQGLTPLPSVAIVEDENGKKYIIFERTNNVVDNGDSVSFEIVVKDNSENCFTAKIEMQRVESDTWQIMDVSLTKCSDLQKTINSINEEIIANEEEYIFDDQKSTASKIYEVLEGKGFTIVSEKFINEAGEFDEALFNSVAEVDAYQRTGEAWVIYGVDIECSKDGESITVRAQILVKGTQIIVKPFKF